MLPWNSLMSMPIHLLIRGLPGKPVNSKSLWDLTSHTRILDKDVAARLNSGGVAGLNLEELAHLNKLTALESLFATKKLFSFYQVVPKWD